MRILRLTLLGLAALSILLLGLGFLERALYRDDTGAAPQPALQSAAPAAGPAPDLRDARKSIERVIASTPAYARFFDRLHDSFPHEYDDILDSLAKKAASGKMPPPADARLADALLADAVTAIRKTSGSFAAKAQDDSLGQVFVMQLKEMQALAQRDAHLCVSFLYGLNGPGFLDFAATHRDLVADAAISGLDAMTSGRQNPAERGMPSDEDFQILDKALSGRGLSRPEIETLLDGKTATPPIPDERMCSAGQVYLQTLGSLDPAVRGRLYSLAVGLMAKS